MVQYQPGLGDRLSLDRLIKDLLKMPIPEVMGYLENEKRWADKLPTGRGSKLHGEQRRASDYAAFIRGLQWFIFNMSIPAGWNPWDLEKVKPYIEHLVSTKAMPDTVLELFKDVGRR